MILSVITGYKILLKDNPIALKIVNSESLLSLSNVKSVPNNKPTGRALPRILGIYKRSTKTAFWGVYIPAIVRLIVFNKISGAIQTIVNNKIATQVVTKSWLKMYLS